jgi:glycine dehydrogenase subunit 2
VQGALELINELAFWLIDLTGMHGVAMSPKAGAHGELCGLLCIRAALEARGDAREVVLVPESAHGTNPATAAFAGYRVENIPANAPGRVDLEALKARLGPDVAGGDDHQPQHLRPVRAGHEGDQRRGPCGGGFVYCDGANFNAIVGKVRPGDLGIDAMHINLHKTFSTPHGGGGPGSGPGGAVRSALAVRAAALHGAHRDGVVHLVEEEQADAFSRAFRRQAELRPDDRLPRPDGHVHPRARLHPQPRRRRPSKQVAEDAVLNANYILRSLEDVLDAPFAHRARACTRRSFSDKGFAEGLSTLDLAKALIDEGFHPMTMYFPLVVHGAMLVEPTETESKAALDQFIAALRSIAERARAGDQSLKAAPVHAPRRRLDETLGGAQAGGDRSPARDCAAGSRPAGRRVGQR